MSQDPQRWQQQPPPPPAGYAPRPTNTMAILALVFAFVLFPLGIVFGHMARGQIRHTGEEGNGLAVAGLVVGYIQLALLVLAIVIIVIVVIVATAAAA